MNNENNETFKNAPNMSLMFTMYSTTFGNGAFQLLPPPTGNMEDGFPSIPYLSLEAIIYQQQSSNPLSAPSTVLAGASAGQQVIGSTQTANDATGIPRYIIGNQNK